MNYVIYFKNYVIFFLLTSLTFATHIQNILNMDHLPLYETINLNNAMDKIVVNSFVEEQNGFYESDGLHWDEYGNPYIYYKKIDENDSE